MRKLGIGILGLFSGLLLGLLISEVVSRIALSGGGDISGNLPLTLFLGLIWPAMGLLGIGVALLVDRRTQLRSAGDSESSRPNG